MAEISEEVLAEDGRQALQYGPAEGHPPLRAFVAEMLRQRGFADATPEHILITNGSQQALDLAARAFLNPGDPVLIETPSYLAAIQIFDSHEAAYLPVPLDVEGMDVEQAAAQIRRPSAPPLHAARLPEPHWASPRASHAASGSRLAAQHTLPVLEDDAYYDLRYEGEPLPPVTALASNPLAVCTGTFSKTIAPGLRVGYLYAQPPLVTCLAHLKQLTDLQAGSFTQRVALRFCERGLLEPQIALLRETYRARRDALLEALADLAPGGEEPWIQWTRPAGGMFVFVTLPPGMDAAALLPPAMGAAWSMCRVRVFTLMRRSAETGLAGGQHAAPELRLRERRGHPSWHPPAGRYPA